MFVSVVMSFCFLIMSAGFLCMLHKSTVHLGMGLLWFHHVASCKHWQLQSETQTNMTNVHHNYYVTTISGADPGEGLRVLKHRPKLPKVFYSQKWATVAGIPATSLDGSGWHYILVIVYHTPTLQQLIGKYTWMCIHVQWASLHSVIRVVLYLGFPIVAQFQWSSVQSNRWGVLLIN